MRTSKYSKDELRASNIYSGILQRNKSIKEWDRSNFIKWYLLNEKKGCTYCGSSLKNIGLFYDITKEHNKRPKRGKSLEVDRKDPKDVNYSENNCVLACYWCNNAKTDTFTFDEAKQIGKQIKKIILKRISK